MAARKPQGRAGSQTFMFYSSILLIYLILFFSFELFILYCGIVDYPATLPVSAQLRMLALLPAPTRSPIPSASRSISELVCKTLLPPLACRGRSCLPPSPASPRQILHTQSICAVSYE